MSILNAINDKKNVISVEFFFAKFKEKNVRIKHKTNKCLFFFFFNNVQLLIFYSVDKKNCEKYHRNRVKIFNFKYIGYRGEFWNDKIVNYT